MDYRKVTTHDITDLSDHEVSAIQAGLVLLANGATQGNGTSYPEFRKTAGSLLGKLNPPQANDR